MGRACQILGKPMKMARTAHFRSHEVFRGDHLVLNDVLTTGSISTDLTDFSTTISGVFGGEKPRKLYLLLEALVVLLCVVYYVCAERTYQTDTYKVTDNISVPVPSGQGQHGTAWFMSDKIK